MQSALRHREVTARTGMIFFLGSWWMMFAAMFFTFLLLRARQTMWPPIGLAPISSPGLMVSTTSVVLSSVGVELGRRRSSRAGIGAAAIFAMLFLVSQAAIAKGALLGGFVVSSPISGFVAMIALFHAVHAAVGAAALGWLALRPSDSPLTLRLWATYWHFVGVIWLLIYVFVFPA